MIGVQKAPVGGADGAAVVADPRSETATVVDVALDHLTVSVFGDHGIATIQKVRRHTRRAGGTDFVQPTHWVIVQAGVVDALNLSQPVLDVVGIGIHAVRFQVAVAVVGDDRSVDGRVLVKPVDTVGACLPGLALMDEGSVVDVLFQRIGVVDRTFTIMALPEKSYPWAL